MANKRHQRSNPGEGRGNTFPPNPLCPNIKLYQRAIQKTITQATCQLPYSHQKTVQPMGSTLFVYIDPPYTVMHNNNNFIKYNNPIFSWDDQIRLSKCIRRASDRGAKIMLSNAAHKSVFKLYDNFGSHLNLKRRSILAASSSHRLLTDELLIVNY